MAKTRGEPVYGAPARFSAYHIPFLGLWTRANQLFTVPGSITSPLKVVNFSVVSSNGEHTKMFSPWQSAPSSGHLLAMGVTDSPVYYCHR